MSVFSIRNALIGVFSTLILVIFGLSSFSFTGMNTLYANTEDIADKRLPLLNATTSIQSSLNAEQLTYATHLLAVNQAQMEKAQAMVNDAANLTDTHFAEFEAIVSDAADAELFAKMKELLVAYRTNGLEMLELSADNGKNFARAIFEKDMAEIADQIDADVNQLVQSSLASVKSARAESVSTFNKVNLTIIVMAAIALLVAIGAIVFALIGIAMPISRITESMKNLAAGDHEKAIPFSKRRDEIGSMAGAIEVFRQAAISNLRMEKEAEAARQEAEANRVKDQKLAEAEAARRMREATAGLAAGLKRLAAGDLSFQLNEEFASDFESLRQDFNISISQLAETMVFVTSSVGTMTEGSQEISASISDLSKRTEQQAAALEETAAALDQITVNVGSSSDRTQEARTVATEANASATKSGLVVAQAVEAMSRIEGASDKISNIIGVIDQIAFQTNLLALNAGVEAARAGEAGRGFAVVAQEVRELAQRSANAAKEIKDLIQSSTTEVSAGVKLVSETGISLKEINEYILRINEHMDAIAAAALDQSAGLASINTTINSMDETTQQNAAMVEESSAAASTLAMEAAKLGEMMTHFELTDVSNQLVTQSEALRQTGQAMAESTSPQPRAKAYVSNGNTAVDQEWSEF